MVLRAWPWRPQYCEYSQSALRDLRDHIHSSEFAAAARGPDEASAFTRRRKLSLATLIAALLCQRNQAQQVGLDHFFGNLADQAAPERVASRGLRGLGSRLRPRTCPAASRRAWRPQRPPHRTCTSRGPAVARSAGRGRRRVGPGTGGAPLSCASHCRLLVTSCSPHHTWVAGRRPGLARRANAEYRSPYHIILF